MKQIFSHPKISSDNAESRGKLIIYSDGLRQRARVKGARLSRYGEATKRKEQNNLFQKKEKQFYRAL